ncbi:energy transducer TonB [Kordiimonas sp. SCSIO 12610]|uniref:energy transducer TonB n=1 Tax=Kordiimonas sp. SCSIO 12610 TaxID=2829597 RepID=UPI002109672A|nr:energy transducer TonB [Kordiimonas sp. SCSIO 12610]UTW54614.1 energy transducer TonB [Kordiimonas sp. SCSIO 12610]
MNKFIGIAASILLSAQLIAQDNTQSNNGETEEEIIYWEQPVYPQRALNEKVEGYVTYQFTVGPDGKVTNDLVLIVTAKPRGYFERATRKAIKKLRFKPATKNGLPTTAKDVWYRFDFTIPE